MSRDHASDGDAETARYPVMTDKPVEITSPRRKVSVIAISYALAIVAATVVGAYVSASVALERNDEDKQQLRAEIEQAKRHRDAESTAFRAALDQYRRDMCAVTGGQEQTPAVVDIRTRYRCGDLPPTPSPPSTGASAPPAQRSPPSGMGGGQSTPDAPHGRAGKVNPQPPGAPAPPRPAPEPAPPPPPPAPEPPGPPPDPVCLPLVGICLEIEVFL